MQPTLLYLANSDWIGGMERSVINLSKEFSARGWAVRSVFIETPRSGALLAWARDQGVAAESSPALLSYFDRHTYRQMLSLRRLVADSRADIVHLHVGSNFLPLKDMLALRLSGTRARVASIHSAERWHRGNRRSRQKTRIGASLCDGLIVHSGAARAVLIDAGVPSKKVHLSPLGLHPPAAPPSVQDARRRLDIPSAAFVVSTNARLETHKGAADLIEAIARMADPERRAMLLIAGEGPERASLEALAARRIPGQTRFMGHLADHADLYAASDVFAMPTHDGRESFGLVYIEAAFHAIPSVGTRVGGIPEAIRDGETGLLVAPRSPDELAAALDRLLLDGELRTRLGRAAYARAHDLFTVQRMADRYEEIYRGLLRAPRDMGRAREGMADRTAP